MLPHNSRKPRPQKPSNVVAADTALGMTLREYYAGLAMQSAMAAPGRPAPESIALISVRMADALIAALAK